MSRDLGASESRQREARENRAAGFNQQAKSGIEGETERKVRTLATVPGRITTAALVASPEDLARRIKTGALTASEPLVAGEKIGPVKIRPDTVANATVAITNGKVDFARTRIDLCHADGSPTDLDGPLWLDPEKLYIDNDGHIRADVPCFPDPNITKTVLGDGVDRVPEDPGEFAKLIGQRANLSGGLPLMPSFGARATPPGSAPVGTPGSAPADGTPGLTARPPAGTDAKSALGRALDPTGLRVGFSGELLPGPLKLGDGVVLNLAEGATVKCKEGKPGELKVEIDAPVRSLQMDAEGTRLRSGPGRIKIDVDFNGLPPGETTGERGPVITFHELELENVNLETPAGSGTHKLQIRDRIAIRGDAAGEPFLTFRGARGDTPASMKLRFPELALQQVTGELELAGTDGKPARLALGDDGSGVTKPVSAAARIEVDSTRGYLLFDGRIDDFTSSITPLALLDTDGFDLKLGKHRLTGSGRLTVRSEEGKSSLKLKADAGAPWTLSGAIDDAQIGTDVKSAALQVDVKSGSSGTLRLDELELGTEGTPILRGGGSARAPAAEFAVSVDSLSLKLPGGHDVSIREGTSGTLVIPTIEWRAGDKSPKLDAKLVLDIDANALLKPGKIPGLEGATVSVDAKTGQTRLTVDVTLDEHGRVSSAVNVRVRNFEVSTDLARGMAPLDGGTELKVPASRLVREPAPDLKPMRTLAAVEHGPQPPAPEATRLQAPTVPQLAVKPAQIFGAIDSAEVSVKIPTAAIAGTKVTQGAWSFDFQRNGDAPLALELALAGGRVQPGTSRITIDPPLVIKTVGKGLRPNPDITVRSATIRDAGNGKGRLDLDVDIKHLGLAILDIVPGWDTEEYVEDLVAEKIFGASRFPLDGEALLANVAAKTGAIPETLRVGGTGESRVAPAGTPPPEKRPAAASAAVAPAATAPGGAAELKAAFDLWGSSVEVKNAKLATERLDFGNGQGIHFRPGSQLTVSGTARDFTISGHAAFGRVDLGSGANRALLEKADADLRIRVQIGADGKPRVTVDIDNLKEVSNLTVAGRVGAGVTNATFAKVGGGSIHLDLGGGKNDVKLQLTGVEGTLLGGADVGKEDRRYAAQSFGGKVSGNVTFDNGAFRGELENMDLRVQGLSVVSNAAGKNTGEGSITGDATVTYDRSGRLVLERAGDGFRVNADFVTGTGSRYQVQGGTADRLELVGGQPPTLIARNANARFSCVTGIGDTGAGPRAPTLDIRKATLQGDVQFGGADGFKTLGRVQMRDVDASLANLAVSPSEQSRLDLEQLDFSGNGLLEVSRTGGWVISQDASLPPGERAIAATGVTRDLRFATDSPEIHLDLAAGAHATFAVNRLTLGGSRGTSIDLGAGHFQGTVEAGTVTVGDSTSMLNRVKFKPGTIVHADVGYLRSGRYVQGTGLATDITLRIEGKFGDEVAPTEEHGVKLTRLGFSGDTRMILRARTDGAGNFSARSHTLIDGDIAADVGTEVDPASAYARARDQFLAERRRKAKKPTPP